MDNNRRVELIALVSSYFGKLYKTTGAFHAGMELIRYNQTVMIVGLSSEISEDVTGFTFGILLLSGNHLYCYYTRMEFGDCKLYLPQCLELVE